MTLLSFAKDWSEILLEFPAQFDAQKRYQQKLQKSSVKQGFFISWSLKNMTV